MDIFLANNGGNLVEKVLDFGDDFIKKLDNKRNVFWHYVFESWVQVKSVLIKQSDNIKKHILNDSWCNSCVKVESNSLFINVWHKSGIGLVGVLFI